MPEPTYRVKRLEWQLFSCSKQFEYCETILGTFSVFYGVESAEWELSRDGEVIFGEDSTDDDAAKLAAESWYRARLLEALEPVEERT